MRQELTEGQCSGSEKESELLCIGSAMPFSGILEELAISSFSPVSRHTHQTGWSTNEWVKLGEHWLDALGWIYGLGESQFKWNPCHRNSVDVGHSTAMVLISRPASVIPWLLAKVHLLYCPGMCTGNVGLWM